MVDSSRKSRRQNNHPSSRLRGVVSVSVNETNKYSVSPIHKLSSESFIGLQVWAGGVGAWSSSPVLAEVRGVKVGGSDSWIGWCVERKCVRMSVDT